MTVETTEVGARERNSYHLISSSSREALASLFPRRLEFSSCEVAITNNIDMIDACRQMPLLFVEISFMSLLEVATVISRKGLQ